MKKSKDRIAMEEALTQLGLCNPHKAKKILLKAMELVEGVPAKDCSCDSRGNYSEKIRVMQPDYD